MEDIAKDLSKIYNTVSHGYDTLFVNDILIELKTLGIHTYYLTRYNNEFFTSDHVVELYSLIDAIMNDRDLSIFKYQD